MRAFRMLSGVCVWVGVFIALWWTLNTQVMSRGSVGDDLVPALWNYTAGSRVYVDVTFNESSLTGIGDPVFVIHNDGTFTRIGEVVAVGDGSATGVEARAGIWTRQAQVMFYPGAAVGPGATLSFYQTDASMAWMVRTLLPPAKKERILKEINDAIATHQEEILDALLPIVTQTLSESLAVLEEDLPKALDKHKEELTKLGAKYQTEILEKKLTPLVKEEVWPIAKKKAVPLANKIGGKIWERVSVGKFAVRYLWDLNPFAAGDSLEKEWNEFVDKEAVPIVEAHTDEIVKMLQDVVAESSKNEKVRAVFGESVSQVLNDPELHALVWTLIKETMIENPRFHEVLKKQWSSPEAKAALALAGARLEPVVVSIGDQLFGTRETGITPELARVMRFRLLKKDTRWYVLNPASGAAPGTPGTPGVPGAKLVLPVKPGADPLVHPFVPDTPAR